MGISRITKNASEIKRRLDARRQHGMKAIFTNDEGAIDLASIMVGVLVIGIIAGVIAATVFAVIPWSQNNAAQQNLDAVKTAESVQYAQSAGNGTATFLADTDLTGTTNASGKSLLQSNPNVKVVIDTNGDHFIAASRSATGNVYYTSDDGKAPSTTAPTDAGDAVAPTWNTSTSTWN